MNCKPGDLAVVVSSTYTPELLGHLVTVVRWVPEGEVAAGTSWEGSGWLCKSEHTSGAPISWPERGIVFQKERVIADKNLRPIRPGDLEDETPTVRELEAA